jgi:hypothetical protein
MGAIVTIKVKPDADIEHIKMQVQKALSGLGEPVTVHVTAIKSQQFNISAPQPNKYVGK